MARRDDVLPKGPDDTAVTVWLAPEVKARLKVIASESGLSMASYVRRLVQRVVEETPQPVGVAANGKARGKKAKKPSDDR